MTATYWEISRRIVEFEQRGKRRAEYGEQLIERLAEDLMKRFGRGFGVDNLQRMRLFYQLWQSAQICATLSRKSLNRRLLRGQILNATFQSGELRIVSFRNFDAQLLIQRDDEVQEVHRINVQLIPML
jgi:hypothetical protein